MVFAQVKYLQGNKVGNLVKYGTPDEVVTEVQSFQRSTMREMERDGLVEEVVSKVEV